MREDCQEVARSTLVKGIESKMAAVMFHINLTSELLIMRQSSL
jgi:hypothetical protein